MATKNVNVRIKNRADTAANWTANNPVLLSGEFGIESDTLLMKVGDGASDWNTLGYIGSATSIDPATKRTFGTVRIWEELDTLYISTLPFIEFENNQEGENLVIEGAYEATLENNTLIIS